VATPCLIRGWNNIEVARVLFGECALEGFADESMSRGAGLTAAGMAILLLAGCHVESTKNGDGKNVNISTPFGGMQVDTNGADVTASLGLPAYPGAQVLKQSGGDDNKDDSADVNMSFGGFQLRVKAAKFRSDDSTDKVEAFYRDKLKRYGDVVGCRNHVAVGTPVRTAEGLTCDDNHGAHISVDDKVNNNTLELRTGSPQHQHIVTIDADHGGTKFSIVALDLPGKMNFDGGNDDTRQ
jgi:hypothetical protein